MKFSKFKAAAPFPERTTNDMNTLGIPSTETLNYQTLKGRVDTLVAALGGTHAERLEEIRRAHIRLRLYLRRCFYSQMLQNYSDMYTRKAKAIKDLVYALQRCVIKHRQAPELYKTLASISIWIKRQEAVFIATWRNLPDDRVAQLRTKANIIKYEAESVALCYAELRYLCRYCRCKGENKIIIRYPYPNEALMDWFRDFQNDCGWVAIPASLRMRRRARNRG